MRRAAGSKDKQERLGILGQAEAMLIEQEVPILLLYHYVNLMAFRDEVTGIYCNAREMHPFKYIKVNE
jgi:ABC-type oligopeptide transport system substrate-binding subunit